MDKEFSSIESKPHLLLLSKFIQGRSIDDFSNSENWTNVLGELPVKSIKRFVNEEFLMAADLETLLAYECKLADLKEMLKQRNLSSSGKKNELIQRLIEKDQDGMKNLTANLSIYMCTQSGKEIVEQYLFAEKEKRLKIEKQVIEYISNKQFKDASLLVAT